MTENLLTIERHHVHPEKASPAATVTGLG